MPRQRHRQGISEAVDLHGNPFDFGFETPKMPKLPLFLVGLACIGCAEPTEYTAPEAFELQVPQQVIRLNEGESQTVQISVVRGMGRTEDLEILLEGLPAGVTADAARIASDTDSTEIVLHAKGAALHTKAAITVTGRGKGLAVDATMQVFIAGHSGTVDGTYGNQGSSSFPLLVSQAFELKSGGILLQGVAGGTKLLKLTADGTVDEGFGDGGYLTPSFPNGLKQEQASSLIVVESADEKLLIITALDDTGTAGRPDALSVSRYAANGTLDQSYGSQGHVLDPVPNRPYAAALGIDGDLLLWNGAANDSRMTRILSTGAVGASSPTFDTSVLLHVAARLIVQPDGKAVVPAYETGLKPALYRFDTSLRLDTLFGQNGKLATNIPAFNVRRTSDGGYTASSSTGDPSMPAVMRFDSLWRPLTGFESGRVAFPTLGLFTDSVSLDGSTLAVGHINNAARIGRVLDNGMIDSAYGVDGLAAVTPLATGDAPRAIHVASHFGLFVFVGRNTSRSTEVIRVWQ